MGLANNLTLLRIVLIPVFVALLLSGHGSWALGVFVLAGLTDTLDGYIARTQKKQTRLGAVLDPAADKLLMAAAFLSLALMGRVPAWIVVLVMGRDLLLILGTAFIHVTGGQVYPHPTLLGKATTLFQMGTVLVALLASLIRIPQAFWTSLLLATAGLTVASGVQYLFLGRSLLSPSRRS